MLVETSAKRENAMLRKQEINNSLSALNISNV
jgi:hypothetical protein